MMNIEQTTNNKETNQQATTEAATSITSTSTTTSSSTHGTGRVLLDPSDFDIIAEHYDKILGPLNAYKARDIIRAAQNGLEVSAIIDAIDQTAMAPRPSHYYLRAVLTRYWSEGLTTVEKVQEDRLRRYHEQSESKGNDWHNWYGNLFDPLDLMP